MSFTSFSFLDERYYLRICFFETPGLLSRRYITSYLFEMSPPLQTIPKISYLSSNSQFLVLFSVGSSLFLCIFPCLYPLPYCTTRYPSPLHSHSLPPYLTVLRVGLFIRQRSHFLKPTVRSFELEYRHSFPLNRLKTEKFEIK